MRLHEASQTHFARAAKALGLSAQLTRQLATPTREIKVELTIPLDSGETATFDGFRVQHDDSRGPMKGGSSGSRTSSSIAGPRSA